MAYNKKADKNYRETHRKHRNYLSSKAAAKSFIKNYANKNDLEELMELIKNKLKNEPK